MVKSMTGFGKITIENGNRKVVIEIKSLNSKTLDLNLKMPNLYKEKEMEIRNIVKEQLDRGKVEMCIYFDNTESDKDVTINKPVVTQYFNQLLDIANELGIEADKNKILQTVMRFPDTLQIKSEELEDTEWEALEAGIKKALEEINKFRIQEGLTRAFRDFLYSQEFTEIHTPKIGAKGAEGGANIFKLEYFHRPAVLAQSPQFYKQMMVGVFDRVFETAPVFRAEKHNTKRHLNEYTSLDFEMGYIDGFEDIMAMETGFLQYAMKLLKKDYARELKVLGVELPDVSQIPAVKFADIKEIVAEKYNHKMRNPFDLEPEEEVLIGRYAKEEWGSDFVFVTHYPSKKRPFYAMDDPDDPRFTRSFDLLFRGLEVTTGGQRIHDYRELLAKIEKRGMDTEGMDDYLNTFKYGMPPHGGLGIGLERMTMQLLGEENVREVSLFPRDMSRLVP